MASVSLPDQMNAKAVIDQLRHNKLLVQEHLDLPARRRATIERLRSFYHGQGIEVDDALIERGVREYFDGRLVFEAKPAAKLQASLASLYVTRAKWSKPAAMCGAAVIALASLTAIGVQAFDAGVTRGVIESSIEAQRSQNAMIARMTQLTKRLGEVGARQQKSPVDSAARSLAEAKLSLGEAEPMLLPPLLDSGVRITSENRDAIHGLLEPGLTRLAQVDAKLVGAGAAIARAAAILDLDVRMKDVMKFEGYEAARSAYPALLEAERAASRAISAADEKGAEPAKTRVNALVTMFNDVARADGVLKEINEFDAKFRRLGLSGADLDTITAMVVSGKSHIGRLEIADAREVVEKLGQTMEFVETPLKINVVSRPGEKSGVERTFRSDGDSSGGNKSWFAIVEAIDPAGRVVPVAVASADTGEKTVAKKFAVRISQEVYNAIRDDKKADGHVDEKEVGYKPANALTINYSRAFSKSPDIILEW